MKCALLLKWHTDWAAASQTLTQQSATWLYALTARLERPLTQVQLRQEAIVAAAVVPALVQLLDHLALSAHTRIGHRRWSLVHSV